MIRARAILGARWQAVFQQPASPLITEAPSVSRASAIAALSLAMFLASLGTSITNVGLPTLARAFGVSFPAVQWIVITYLLTVTTLAVGAGRLGDAFGRRRLLLAGIIVYTLASLACAGAETFAVLIAMRAIQGLGGALMMTMAMALVSDSVAADRIGRAMGLLGTASAAGTALGPTLGGVLIDRFGWHALFLGNVPVGIAALALGWHGLPRTLAASGGRFDAIGAMFLGAALACGALAMTLDDGLDLAGRVGVVAVASLAGAGFALRARTTRSPLVRIELLGDRRIRAGLVGNTLVTSVAMATLVVGPFYLGDALNLDASRTGLVMSVGPLVAAVSGLPAGRGVDRWGAPRMAVAGLSAMALGSGALSWLSVATGVLGYLVPLTVLTGGFSMFQAANNAAVMAAAGTDQRGVVSGLLNLSRNLGLLAGASVLGAIFAAGGGAAAGARAAFAACTVLIAASLAIVLHARRGDTARRDARSPGETANESRTGSHPAACPGGPAPPRGNDPFSDSRHFDDMGPPSMRE